jgi:hypothetical protein
VYFGYNLNPPSFGGAGWHMTSAHFTHIVQLTQAHCRSNTSCWPQAPLYEGPCVPLVWTKMSPASVAQGLNFHSFNTHPTLSPFTPHCQIRAVLLTNCSLLHTPESPPKGSLDKAWWMPGTPSNSQMTSGAPSPHQRCPPAPSINVWQVHQNIIHYTG